MKNRFQEKKTFFGSGLLLSVVLMAGSFGFFWCGICLMQEETQEKEQTHLEQVLNQSAAVCYALEGRYPESLSYLKEQYGIYWKEEEYLVDFERIGSNLPPDITVISRKTE